MIFKKLFAPTYTSDDPNVRIESLDKLDVTKEKDKSIVHELAFNDASDKVKIAALKHLNSFVLWVKTAETTSSAMIKKNAQQQCYELVEQPHVVDDKLFKAYISEMKNKSVLQHLLFNCIRLNEDKFLSMNTLLNIDSERVTKKYFAEKADVEQQLAIIEKTEDEKLLHRFMKQAKNMTVELAVKEKLEHLDWLKQQPIQVKQRAVLINALLLKLKDVDDYATLKSELDKQITDFESLKNKFAYLSEQDAAELSTKYLSLKNTAQLKLQTLAESHNKELAAKKLNDDIHKLTLSCEQISEQIELCISEVESDVTAQIKIFERAISTASEELSNLKSQSLDSSRTNEVDRISALIDENRRVLMHLPESKLIVTQNIQVLAKARELLDNVEQNAVTKTSLDDKPDIATARTLETEFSQLQKAFKENIESQKVNLPKQTKQAFSQEEKRFRGILHKINANFKQHERKIEQKLRVVNRLIVDGKYKPAISTFHHTKLLINKVLGDNLGEIRFKRIAKLYDSTLQEVEKLQDWQAYVAQPRKPALLIQARELVLSKFVDGYERAEAVKRLRQEWSSFGHLYTDEDDQLNTEFDVVLEQAFAPCREFFAKIETQRQENAKSAQRIIDEAKQLDFASLEQALHKKLSQLRQAFRSIVDLDKKEATILNREFNKAIRPLTQAIEKEQADNAARKNELLKAASRLENMDDLQQAVNEAKKLQFQWKTIGFAGKGKDNQLWHAFREKNDAIFGKFHQVVNKKQAEQDQALRAVENEINEISIKIDSSRAITDLEFFEQSFAELETHFRSLAENSQKKVHKKIQNLSTSFHSAVKKFNQERENTQLKSLFECLQSADQAIFLKESEKLPSKYRTWALGNFEKHPLLGKYDHKSLLMVLSILVDKQDIADNIDLKALKKQVQLALMTAKLQGERMPNKEDVLKHWTSLGAIKKADKDLLSLFMQFYLGSNNIDVEAADSKVEMVNVDA
ncbi:DUF349 domain-containing protein [Glaciecola petra]|uniref:DUF349 domain-containing protein n=1 Tax=Glaciecola petra TaxID=3075602 RepID=A0ABU2ZN42_9ALTE|nr:DUF349 domain-containing protein [Aestuariibacter sp. P117]MDT0594046.1 DUF349 domain-containing protein [Aestuariibacter sp. P117]